MTPFEERTHTLLGDAGLETLHNAHVLIAGLGGVGSYAVEALARAGVGKLTLVDHDVVAASNLNRQLVGLQSTVGQPKALVMAGRIHDINPNCELNLLQEFIRPDDMDGLVTPQFDAVIDAIDSLSCKAALVETAWRKEISIFSSMGAGGKLDPTKIKIGDLFKSEGCGLARMMRKRLRRRGIKKGVQAVWSSEIARPPAPAEETGCGRPRVVNGTISYLPALFGLTLAGMVVNHLLEENEK